MPRAAKPAVKAPARKPAPRKTAKPAAKACKPAPQPAAAPAPSAPARKGKSSLQDKLTPKAELFVTQYLIDLNATQAYLRSHPGVKTSTANVEGCRLLANPKVQEAIAAGRAKTADKLEITREALLSEVWGIVRADPRDLVEHIVRCCRHCHGIGHAYQWRNEEEFENAHEQALTEFERKRASRRDGEPEPKLRLPTDAGGYGFDPRLAPHYDCSECLGAGQGRTILKDTRTLSSQALSLYAGIKETEKGVEVKFHSKLDAAEKLFKHLGLYEKDNEQKGKGAAEAIAEFVAGIHARQAGRLPIAAPKNAGPLRSSPLVKPPKKGWA